MMDILQIVVILLGAHFFHKYIGSPYFNLTDVESYIVFVILLIVYDKYGGKLKQTISSFGRRR